MPPPPLLQVGAPLAATEFRLESVPELKYDALGTPPKVSRRAGRDDGKGGRTVGRKEARHGWMDGGFFIHDSSTDSRTRPWAGGMQLEQEAWGALPSPAGAPPPRLRPAPPSTIPACVAAGDPHRSTIPACVAGGDLHPWPDALLGLPQGCGEDGRGGAPLLQGSPGPHAIEPGLADIKGPCMGAGEHSRVGGVPGVHQLRGCSARIPRCSAAAPARPAGPAAWPHCVLCLPPPRLASLRAVLAIPLLAMPPPVTHTACRPPPTHTHAHSRTPACLPARWTLTVSFTLATSARSPPRAACASSTARRTSSSWRRGSE